MRVIVVVAALVLAGCTSNTWQRPGLDPAVADRQREIDTAECTVISMRAIPLPNPPPTRARLSAPSEYSIQGTTTVYGPNGEVNTGNYSGTATPIGFGGGDGVASGIAAVQAMQDHSDAINARANLANACMLERGWVKVRMGQEATAGPAVAQASTASASPVQGSAPISVDLLPPALPSAPAAQRYNEWSKARGDN